MAGQASPEDDDLAEGSPVDLQAVASRAAQPDVPRPLPPATRVVEDAVRRQIHLGLGNDTGVETKPVAAGELAAADQHRAMVRRRAEPFEDLAAPSAAAEQGPRGRDERQDRSATERPVA